MATFNTAFGALPKPKDQLFGNRQQPKPQQPQPPQQGQQGQGGGATFSQMQANGQARPAPPQGQPQPPLLGALQQQMKTSGPTHTRFTAKPGETDEQLRRRAMVGAAPQSTYIQSSTFGPSGAVNETLQGDALAALRAPAGGETPAIPPAPVATEGGAEAPEMGALAVDMGGAPSPAAPMAAGPSAAVGGSSSSGLRSRLEQQLESYLSGGSVYDDPAYAAYRNAQLANMQAEFGAQRSQLEEQLAARGLSASSIAGGRYGDLAGQQARARASMEAELMKEAAARQEARGQFGVSQLGSLAQVAGQQEMAQKDIELRAQQLQQEERLRGRDMDISEARDKAANQLGYAEIGSRERMSANELAARRELQLESQRFQSGESALERDIREKSQLRDIEAQKNLQTSQQTFTAGQSQLERDLRTAMQTRDLTAQEKRQLADIEAQKNLQASQQTFTAGQSQLERDLREKMQTTELSAAEKRQLAEIEANRLRQQEQQKFQSGESALERELRQALGVAELTGTYGGQRTIGGQQVDISRQNQTLNQQNQTFQQEQAKQQFLIQLAGILAPMSQKDRDAFLRSNPQFASLLTGSRPAGSFESGGVGQYGGDTGI